MNRIVFVSVSLSGLVLGLPEGAARNLALLTRRTRDVKIDKGGEIILKDYFATALAYERESGGEQDQGHEQRDIVESRSGRLAARYRSRAVSSVDKRWSLH